MTGRVTGKVVLVTGGGGGIGQATAQLFWDEGASVAVVDSDADEAKRAGAEIAADGDRVLALGARLDDEAEARRAVDVSVQRFGRLDVFANVAGVRVWGPVTEADTDSWDFILRGNLLQVGYCSKYAVPAMIRGG